MATHVCAYSNLNMPRCILNRSALSDREKCIKQNFYYEAKEMLPVMVQNYYKLRLYAIQDQNSPVRLHDH